MITKAFYNGETLTNSYRTIRFLDHDFIGFKKLGSFNVIQARLFGLSYPDYLRMLRSEYNATLCGKQGYSYAIFKDSKDCDRICKELNKRWAIVKEALSNVD